MVTVFTGNARLNCALDRLFVAPGRRDTEGDEECRRGADKAKVQEPNRYLEIIVAGRKVEIAVIENARRFPLSAEIDCERGRGMIPSGSNGEAEHDQPGGK